MSVRTSLFISSVFQIVAGSCKSAVKKHLAPGYSFCLSHTGLELKPSRSREGCPNHKSTCCQRLRLISGTKGSSALRSAVPQTSAQAKDSPLERKTHQQCLNIIFRVIKTFSFYSKSRWIKSREGEERRGGASVHNSICLRQVITACLAWKGFLTSDFS